MKVRPKEQGARACTFGGYELFRDLTEEESRKVARRLEESRFLAGSSIFRKDDSGDSLFVLKEGLVKLVSRSERGSGTILHVLRPPEIFGELLLVEERRLFDAVAVTETLAGTLSRDHLVELLSSVPRIRLNFIKILSRRLVRVQKEFTEFSHARSYHRLARVLLRMSGEFGEETPGGVILRLSLTHADLADMIGTTRETVTNQLIRFNRLGLVDACGHLLVVNRRRLTDFVHSGEKRLEEEGVPLDKTA
jgi:CRP-like cAMP-binding protein